MTNSLAFKFVVSALLLNEVNYCSQQLHLAPQEIKPQDVRGCSVGRYDLGFGGHVGTDKYEFDFSDCCLLRWRYEGPGRRYIMHNDDLSGVRRRDMDNVHRNMEFAGKSSKISADGAYQMASNWLVAISVDVKRLEKEHPHTVIQRFYYEHPKGIGEEVNKGVPKIMLPIYDVKWGEAVVATINGVTLELLKLRQEDASFSMRPAVLISLQGASELEAIPDATFEGYSDLDRSNLVAMYVAAYQHLIADTNETH